MIAKSISFWIQTVFAIVVAVVLVIWMVRFLVMKAKADKYLKELGLKVEINKAVGGFEVITKPAQEGQEARKD